MRKEVIINHQDDKLTNQFYDEHNQPNDSHKRPKRRIISNLIDCLILATLKIALCLPSLIIARYMGLEIFQRAIVLTFIIGEFIYSYKDADQKLEDFKNASLAEIVNFAVIANGVIIVGAGIAFWLKTLLLSLMN
jgi:hypothetical protein